MAGSATMLRIARSVTRTCSLPATRVNPDRRGRSDPGISLPTWLARQPQVRAVVVQVADLFAEAAGPSIGATGWIRPAGGGGGTT
jgi:hypothetical protein